GDTDGTITSSVNGGTPGYSYTWTNSNNAVIGTDPTLANLGIGTYCLEVTDNNNCVTSACASITQPPTPMSVTSTVVVYDGGFNVSCYNACDGGINLTVSGGIAPYTYQWELGNGQLDNAEDQINLCAGNYEVLVTDANNCSQLLQFTLTQPSQVQLEITESSFNGGYNISCFNACDGSISTTPSGGQAPYTVNWLSPSLPTGPAHSDLCAGAYQIQVVDANNCSSTYNLTLTQPQLLTVSIDTTFICSTGILQLCADVVGGTGPYGYSWSNEMGNSVCINEEEDGSSCVNITDNNGCTAEACEQYIIPEVLLATLDITDATCSNSNGAIDVTVSGGSGPFTYAWDGQGTVENQQDQTGLDAGAYSVTITGQNGCSVFLSGGIIDLDNITVSAVITPVLCYGEETGAIAVTVQGANNPVTVSWFSGESQLGNSNPLTNVGAGVYTFNWEDAGDCSGTEIYTVSGSDSIVIHGSVSLYENGYNISLPQGSDGAIETEVTGGTPGYTYDWSPNDENDGESGISGLSAGTYTLTVTDASGCSVDTTIILTDPLEFEFPTGFSPNDDIYNQFYVIHGIEGFPDNEFRVFNRWGNLVYDKKDYNNEWEGQNNKGELLPDGTYFIVFVTSGREFNTYVDLRR
ncbi:MAG: gliding motility-associated C-terminal domain-containing protein, partial [Crocinitomicaceae bacterium]|nr:gliding motility-associated C-terminal domain-containing protein [Crocinitomicaceae bacterium]